MKRSSGQSAHDDWRPIVTGKRRGFQGLCRFSRVASRRIQLVATGTRRICWQIFVRSTLLNAADLPRVSGRRGRWGLVRYGSIAALIVLSQVSDSTFEQRSDDVGHLRRTGAVTIVSAGGFAAGEPQFRSQRTTIWPTE